MINEVCGNWTTYHSLAASAIFGMLIWIVSVSAITINEWMARRADRKLAKKQSNKSVAVSPDTVYNHAIHGH